MVVRYCTACLDCAGGLQVTARLYLSFASPEGELHDVGLVVHAPPPFRATPSAVVVPIVGLQHRSSAFSLVLVD